jgi:hypothetical protein
LKFHFKSFIRILFKPISVLANLGVSIIGIISLIADFFRVYPQLIIPKLIQIYLPLTFFGKLVWAFYYQVFIRFRKYHVHVIATTGAGKSFLLLHLIYRDILKGYGLVVIEPHSQLISHILHLKILGLDHKKEFYKKILLLDFEDEIPPALNLFAIELPKDKKQREMQINSVVQNYMEAFEKAFEIPYGTRRVLKNILTVLFYLKGATLLDALEILQPKETLSIKYIELFNNLENPILKKYFGNDFFGSRTDISKEALRLRIEHLLLDRQIRKSLTSPNNILNIEQVFYEGRIVLVKAGESIGQESSRFIGALIHQLILFGGFKRISRKNKKLFSIYLDECQNYMSRDVSKGLDEARKSRIQYTLAHQRMRQRDMTRDQQRALNACGVKIYGRLEYEDAWRLCRQLLMRNEQNKFVNLRIGEFFVKAGWLKTRFIKVPRYFAPHAEDIGKIEHKLFCKTKDFKALIRFLKNQNQLQSDSKTNDNNKNSKSSKFSLNYDF